MIIIYVGKSEWKVKKRSKRKVREREGKGSEIYFIGSCDGGALTVV